MYSDPNLHDVLIIGAGPAGLALAARLCEHTPSAVFTDDEHSRYHWLRKHQNRMSIKNSKTGRVKPAAINAPAASPHRPTGGYSTLVLDATTDGWLGRWRKLFGTFEISHLRSPMFFHVDPADRDGLLAYTHDNSKDGELVEIAGCVGREQSKHQRKQKLSGKHKKFRGEVTINEREREDYFTPSQRLFASHCECVIDRYGLREGLVRQEGVVDIRYADVPHVNEDEPVFTVKTDQGEHFARTVVLAVGPGNAPCIPGVRPGQSPLPQCCHSMQIQRFPDPSVTAAIKQGRKTNVLVVGGGLTSAQLSDMAVRHGVSKVWHLMRGECRVKPFDVDLPWMGKFRNLEQAIFWSADSDAERLEQIKSARGGGSMTPAFHKILKAHIAKSRLSLHTHTTISSREFDTATKTWRVVTDPPISDLPPIDYIYYATGIQTDFTTLPFLQTMLREHPIHGPGGLPCLNDDLMWKDGVPLFVTGRLASLRLGPGAGNLGGARIGAERIAWSLMDHLGSESVGGHSSDSGHEELLEYASARGNRYANLAVGE